MTRHQRAARATMTDPNGREIVRRNKLEYWFDLRKKAPTPFARGFPNDEANAIKAAGRLIMTGIVSKIRCTDRVLDRVQWTLIRGDRVPGTNLFAVLPFRGDREAA